jgi:hypothetical protein
MHLLVYWLGLVEPASGLVWVCLQRKDVEWEVLLGPTMTCWRLVDGI